MYVCVCTHTVCTPVYVAMYARSACQSAAQVGDVDTCMCMYVTMYACVHVCMYVCTCMLIPVCIYVLWYVEYFVCGRVRAPCAVSFSHLCTPTAGVCGACWSVVCEPGSSLHRYALCMQYEGFFYRDPYRVAGVVVA